MGLSGRSFSGAVVISAAGVVAGNQGAVKGCNADEAVI